MYNLLPRKGLLAPPEPPDPLWLSHGVWVPSAARTQAYSVHRSVRPPETETNLQSEPWAYRVRTDGRPVLTLSGSARVPQPGQRGLADDS